VKGTPGKGPLMSTQLCCYVLLLGIRTRFAIYASPLPGIDYTAVMEFYPAKRENGGLEKPMTHQQMQRKDSIPSEYQAS
jgi:hypothetical protein